MRPLLLWSSEGAGFLAFTLLTLATACSDAIVESPVPAYNISYSCNISTINAAMQETDLPNLDCQPGVALVNKWTNLSDVIGVCGLLLYHAATEDVFYAYDLACPYCYEHSETVPIEMKDPFTAYCPTCLSEFGAIQYGSAAPTAGPANEDNLFLRQYRARMVSYSTLVVTRK